LATAAGLEFVRLHVEHIEAKTFLAHGFQRYSVFFIELTMKRRRAENRGDAQIEFPESLQRRKTNCDEPAPTAEQTGWASTIRRIFFLPFAIEVARRFLQEWYLFDFA